MTENARSDTEKEQMQFYEKIASYIGRHPEFVDELQKRIKDDEKNYFATENKEEENRREKKSKGFLKLDEERIDTISEELSGLLFNKDGSNKSVLEKTVQDAFSSVVKNYLSKYV